MLDIELTSPWNQLEKVEHELTVALPSMLLSLPEEQWPQFSQWLLRFAQEIVDNPEKVAYSIG